MNNILLTDSYKLSHFRQYPQGTERIYSYFESRGGRYPAVVFFGLQYLLKRYLVGDVIDLGKIDEAEKFCDAHMNNPYLFNRVGWDHVNFDHGGKLPVSIKAVPEGTIVPTHNVLMTIENTCDRCFWLTNYLETLLVQTWYPTTVATRSHALRTTILRYLEETGDPSTIDFKLQDFGFRGVSSTESALIGGMAHLVNFKGSDTIAGVLGAKDYYGEPMAGFSIPASEHSTITSWGSENEFAAFRNMLKQYPTGLVACVSDSYDIFHACDHLWGEVLRRDVEYRDGTLVIRPDSGDAIRVLTVDHDGGILRILGDRFGFTVNAKGYKVLNPKVRIIQGDGIKDETTVATILTAMKEAGWSADNIGFGSGGGLLQDMTRDTQRFAFKCSAAKVNGQWRDVYKDPVTDAGKVSKKGRLALVHGDSGYETISANAVKPGEDLLVEVFRDGELLVDQSFAAIRARAGAVTKAKETISWSKLQ